MNIDLKALVAKATSQPDSDEQVANRLARQAAKEHALLQDLDAKIADELLAETVRLKQQNVQNMNELCKCGHPESSHKSLHQAYNDGGLIGCKECDCISYHPPSHDYDLRDTTPIQAIDLKSAAVPALDIYNADDDIRGFEVFRDSHPDDDPGPIPDEHPALAFKIPPQLLDSLPCELQQPQSVIKQPDDPITTDNCAHMCSNASCGRIWTHGPKSSCRYPDQFNQGPCQNCLNGEQRATEDWTIDDRGQVKLLPARIIQVRNATRLTCSNMTIEQLTDHIQYNAKRIAELQADSLETRKMRSEREEQALLEIPESERESFRQALRRGAAKPKKEKAPKAVSAKVREAELIAELNKDMSLQTAKLVAIMMIKTNKTRAEVEAWLND